MKKRLLVFHRNIAPYRIDFFNSLNKEFEMRICLFYSNLTSQKFNYKELEQRFEFSPKYLLDRYFANIKKGIISEIQLFRPDIVLVSETSDYSIIATAYRYFSKKKYKVVSIVDDSYNMIAQGNHFTLRHRILEKLLFPFYDDIICVEPRVESYIKKKWGKGIFFPIIQNDKCFISLIKQALPLSKQIVEDYGIMEKKILLFVGRFVELKNMGRVIQAFKQIDRKDFLFVLIGDGPCMQEWKDLSGNVQNILFVGRKEGRELLAWYNIADLFILASTQEAFGAVTNEALMSGCRVIVSSKAGSQCLVGNGNGVIVDPFNDKDIKDKIIYMLDNTNSRNIGKLRPNNMIFNYYDLFNSLRERLYNL